jgi:hypothetical protein
MTHPFPKPAKPDLKVSEAPSMADREWPCPEWSAPNLTGTAKQQARRECWWPKRSSRAPT